MRSSILNALLTPTQQGVLATTLLQNNRRWYFRELARRLGLQPSTIQRSLHALVEAGILARQKDGNRVYYQADAGCPIYPELRGMLLKTVGLLDVLRDALLPFRKKIRLAFVYGSVAAGRERSDSDVDLMVIGSARLSQMADALADVEARIGREVNPVVYTIEEFRDALRRGRHFQRRVFESELLFVFGTRDDLARVAPAEAPPASQIHAARTGRLAGRGRARPGGRAPGGVVRRPAVRHRV